MPQDNFLAKLPLFLGITASGITWALIAFFLLTGSPFKTSSQPEFYYQQPVSSPTVWESSEKVICYRSSGRWLKFPNACADSCASARNPQVVCAQVETFSCDCGPSQCWNNQTLHCEPN